AAAGQVFALPDQVFTVGRPTADESFFARDAVHLGPAPVGPVERVGTVGSNSSGQWFGLCHGRPGICGQHRSADDKQFQNRLMETGSRGLTCRKTPKKNKTVGMLCCSF